MKLKTGHRIEVVDHGVQGIYKAEDGTILVHTFHRVRFHDQDDTFLHEWDFETQWSHQHPDPGSHLHAIFQHHVDHAHLHHWQKDSQLDKAPIGLVDYHGNLTHPTMQPFWPRQ